MTVTIKRRSALAGFAGFLLSPAAYAQAPAAGKGELQWFGQSAFKLTTPGGKVIMIDPWLTANPKTPAEYKDLDKLGTVDLILVSHGHGDHFGDAVAISKKNGAPVLATAGMGQTLQVLGILTPQMSIRMNKSGTYEAFPGVKITQVHADHSSEMVLKDPATGKDGSYPGGEAVGFIIELENGYKIWHTGDTGLFTDMRFIADYYKPDLLLIPIGGHFVMNPKDAAYATAEWIKPRKVMPMHYGTSPFLRGTPEQFKAALGNAPVEVLAMQPGDKIGL
ncbi:metal-dependent hydrolase [Reyranella sp.]|uniref:metal-dependent hydrolase n=1 Tax=Reyranella sp. TaxID=1929291 RepID=UPI00378502A6